MRARLPLGLLLKTLILSILLSLSLARPVHANYLRSDAAASIFYVKLAPYGTWINHPVYGKAWFPFNVPPDWRPYQRGYEEYPQDYAWLWVSDWKWGWATDDHYGRWAWDGWYGWIWVPMPSRYIDETLEPRRAERFYGHSKPLNHRDAVDPLTIQPSSIILTLPDRQEQRQEESFHDEPIGWHYPRQQDAGRLGDPEEDRFYKPAEEMNNLQQMMRQKQGRGAFDRHENQSFVPAALPSNIPPQDLERKQQTEQEQMLMEVKRLQQEEVRQQHWKMEQQQDAQERRQQEAMRLQREKAQQQKLQLERQRQAEEARRQEEQMLLEQQKAEQQRLQWEAILQQEEALRLQQRETELQLQAEQQRLQREAIRQQEEAASLQQREMELQQQVAQLPMYRQEIIFQQPIYHEEIIIRQPVEMLHPDADRHIEHLESIQEQRRWNEWVQLKRQHQHQAELDSGDNKRLYRFGSSRK